MNDEFRGYVLGLTGAVVDDVLARNAVTADRKVLSPVASIVMGVPRSRLLRGPSPPGATELYGRLALLTIWTVFAAFAMATLVSFLYAPWDSFRVVGLLASTGAAMAALIATLFVVPLLRKRTVRDSDEIGWAGLPWDFLVFGPDLGLFFIAIVLLLLLVIFLVFVVWLPVLFLVLNLMTLGEMWRMFRTVYLAADTGDVNELRRAGAELLGRGAVLSHSWDVYLPPPEVFLAIERRRRLLRVHRIMVALGCLSLLLAGTIVAAKFLPNDAWTLFEVAEAGATLGGFAYFIRAFPRRQSSARH